MKKFTYPSMNLKQWQEFTNVMEFIFSITIETTSGHKRHWGFSFEWCYDIETQSLSLQCLDKPSWVPESVFEQNINGIVNNILPGNQVLGKEVVQASGL